MTYEEAALAAIVGALADNSNLYARRAYTASQDKLKSAQFAAGFAEGYDSALKVALTLLVLYGLDRKALRWVSGRVVPSGPVAEPLPGNSTNAEKLLKLYRNARL